MTDRHKLKLATIALYLSIAINVICTAWYFWPDDGDDYGACDAVLETMGG